jgi:predicted ATPase/class 3 adenylate cyclase
VKKDKAQPSGKIIFLFTDIEGSTKLWEEHPDEMKQALVRHDAILRKEIESRNGYVFKTIGDAFCAAFSSASDALDAAIGTQLSLQNERWKNIEALRIRTALHAGTAEERDGDYFGSDVNRTARLLSIMRGGNIILSKSAADLAVKFLSDRSSFRDLGEHYLRDVSEPIQVFQVVHPALPFDFPLAKVLDPSLTNLPSQLSPFVGRQKDLAEVKRLLAGSRLLTLSGTGGCGKTRLSIEAAKHLASAFQDGIRFVELAPISDPSFVLSEFSRSLGIEDSGGTIISILLEFLKKKQLLILLDNCEHLIDETAHLTESLLQSCSNLRLLVTSRQPLGVSGEQVYRVPSLSIPSADTNPEVSEMMQFDAVQLFVARAKASYPKFALTQQNAPAIAQICRQLDGIPLALELAASRVKVLSPEQIAERLKDSFKLLVGGSRTALPRHQTLLATLDWSYSHLLDQEKLLLQRLSVFSGGFDLKACEKVCSDQGINLFEILDLLTQLVDKSLVQCEESEGETRYHLLRSVREYALQKLREGDGEKEIRAKHLNYFISLAEEADLELTSAQSNLWLEKLELDHDNFRDALAWCETFPEGAGLSIQLSGALWKFWYSRYLSDGRRWLDQALARDNEAFPPPIRGRAYLGAGTISWRQNDYEHVIQYCTKSLELFKASEIKIGIAYSLNSLGSVSNFCGDYQAANKFFMESHSIFSEVENPFGVALTAVALGMVAHWEGNYEESLSFLQKGIDTAVSISNGWCEAFGLAMMGQLYRSLGNFEEAKTALEKSLAIREKIKDRSGIPESLALMGQLLLDQGALKEALVLLQQALKTSQEISWPWMTAFSLNLLGRAAFLKKELDKALDLHRQALSIRQKIGDKRGTAESLEGCARSFLAKGEWSNSAKHFAAAESLRIEIHAPLPPADETENNQNLTLLREKLGEQGFQVM